MASWFVIDVHSDWAKKWWLDFAKIMPGVVRRTTLTRYVMRLRRSAREGRQESVLSGLHTRPRLTSETARRSRCGKCEGSSASVDAFFRYVSGEVHKLDGSVAAMNPDLRQVLLSGSRSCKVHRFLFARELSPKFSAILPHYPHFGAAFRDDVVYGRVRKHSIPCDHRCEPVYRRLAVMQR